MACRLLDYGQENDPERASWEDMMHHLFDLVLDVAMGASILVGVGLLIEFGSSAMELIALR